MVSEGRREKYGTVHALRCREEPESPAWSLLAHDCGLKSHVGAQHDQKTHQVTPLTAQDREAGTKEPVCTLVPCLDSHVATLGNCLPSSSAVSEPYVGLLSERGGQSSSAEFYSLRTECPSQKHLSLPATSARLKETTGGDVQ